MQDIGEIFSFNSLRMDINSGFILRHDIDFSVEKAYEMSKIENELDIKSTYFVLTTSDVYNINSKRNRKMLIDMDKNGFEIGLHFDPTIYGNIHLEKMHIEVQKEINIIENIVGNKVKTISLHNPSIHNSYPVFIGYKNSYSEEFFNTDLYISDSCKSFRGKDIYKFIEKGRNNLVQVLFHPIHFSEKRESYISSFNRIIKDKIESFDKSMHINKTYVAELNQSTLLESFVNYVLEDNYVKKI